MKISNTFTPTPMTTAHQIITKQLAETKFSLVTAIEAGERDFERQAILFEQYVELQKAADYVSGQSK